MRYILYRARALCRGQRGIAGVETAIILIAFVVVASVFASGALSTGLLTSERSKDSIRVGLARARGALELRGAVIAEDTDGDGNVDKVYFQVVNAAGGEPIDLSPGLTIIRYTDTLQSVLFATPAKFSVTPSGNANSNNLLELGEVYQLALLNMEANLTTPLTKSKTFTIEVMPPQGTVLLIERNTPISIARYNDLG